MSLGVLTAGLLAGSALAQDITGTWRTQSGETDVRIARCGSAYCGTIVRASGNPRDTENPDPSLRSRPVVGIQMISNLTGSGPRYSGNLYNYKDGGTYRGTAELSGDNQLRVSGCVMVFCRSQTWTRLR